MAQQEALLADLKDSVTPKLASLDEERTAAMHEVKEHALDNIEISRAKMDAEVKKAIEQVAELREQKKTLQSDLAELLSFKAKVSTASELVSRKLSDDSVLVRGRRTGSRGHKTRTGVSADARPGVWCWQEPPRSCPRLSWLCTSYAR